MESDKTERDRSHQRELMQIQLREENENPVVKQMQEMQNMFSLACTERQEQHKRQLEMHNLGRERFQKECDERKKQHERELAVLQKDHDLASERFRMGREESQASTKEI